MAWRECKGVEPSAHIEGCTPADLKSVKPTGTHPLPLVCLITILKRESFKFVYWQSSTNEKDGSMNRPFTMQALWDAVDQAAI